VLISKLYEGQIAFVQAGVRSKTFEIKRGVKQGDPTRAMLFIAIMQDLLGDLQEKWDRLNSRRQSTKFGVLLKRGQT